MFFVAPEYFHQIPKCFLKESLSILSSDDEDYGPLDTADPSEPGRYLATSLDLYTSLVERHYYALQNKLHPDYVHGSKPELHSSSKLN